MTSISSMPTSRQQLAQRSEAYIKQTLQAHLQPGTPVYLYGSRARKDHHWNSDYDLWIDSALPSALVHAIAEQLDESFVPFKIDIVTTPQVTGYFGEQVKKAAVLWM